MGRWHRIAQNLRSRTPPTPTPDTNSVSLFGGLSAAAQRAAARQPPTLAPSGTLPCWVSQLWAPGGPPSGGVREPPVTLWSSGTSQFKKKKTWKWALRVVDRCVLTPTICLPRLLHATVLAKVEKWKNGRLSIYCLQLYYNMFFQNEKKINFISLILGEVFVFSFFSSTRADALCRVWIPGGLWQI